MGPRLASGGRHEDDGGVRGQELLRRRGVRCKQGDRVVARGGLALNALGNILAERMDVHVISGQKNTFDTYYIYYFIARFVYIYLYQ